MRIYLATWLFDKTLGRSLTKKKASNRLLSYHFLTQQEITNEQLSKYCTSGRLNTSKK
jgi:hypothetical protein